MDNSNSQRSEQDSRLCSWFYLHDDTLIKCNVVEKTADGWRVNRVRMCEDTAVKIIEEEMFIHADAVQSHFHLLKGGKTIEKNRKYNA